MGVKSLKTEILIIGGGPAGLTAGLYAARAGRKTIILEGKGGSRLSVGYKIENYPGFIEIDSCELLQKFRKHAEHFGAEILSADAIDFNLASDPKYVVTRDMLIEAKAVIIATGKLFTREKMIPGEERLLGMGVSYCSTCDGPLYRGQKVCAFGNSDEAAEDVLALHQMGCQVHWILGEVSEITVTPNLLEEIKKKNIPLFLKAGLKLNHKQCIAVDRFQQTNLEGIFAAGDVTCGGMQIITAAGEGGLAAMQTVLYIRGKS